METVKAQTVIGEANVPVVRHQFVTSSPRTTGRRNGEAPAQSATENVDTIDPREEIERLISQVEQGIDKSIERTETHVPVDVHQTAANVPDDKNVNNPTVAQAEDREQQN
jgi:hypothetical protein